jgi:hypothetical protein
MQHLFSIVGNWGSSITENHAICRSLDPYKIGAVLRNPWRDTEDGAIDEQGGYFNLCMVPKYVVQQIFLIMETIKCL